MVLAVKPIDELSPHLNSVRTLWRANSQTLGFFPDGAFLEHARQGHILVALMEEQCVGYILYRTSRQRVTITHLCVGVNHRSQGIAKALVNALSKATHNYSGIKLSCRRDYAVNKMWPQLGFVALQDRPGRSQDGKKLTYWWRDHGYPDLWTMAEASGQEAKLAVVLDANVFFDLNDQKGSRSEESKALLADWLQESVTFSVTTEIHNEIDRNPEPAQRAMLHNVAGNFQTVRPKQEDVDTAEQALRSFFPRHLSESDASDHRQLAKTVAAEVEYFVTRDDRLLKISDDIYHTAQVRTIRPSDLITHLDELRRAAEYRPAALAATPLHTRRAHAGEQDEVVKIFYAAGDEEPRYEFQGRTRRYLADPQRYECRVITDEQANQLAFIVYDRSQVSSLTIVMCRVRRSKAAATLTRFLISQSRLLSSKENRLFTKFSDPSVSVETIGALQESGFKQVNDVWMKANLRLACPAVELAEAIDGLSNYGEAEEKYCRRLSAVLKLAGAADEPLIMAETETSLWPAKVLDANIPTFIVPIQPRWAQHLFDTGLAVQTLYGADERLALSPEAVYYRSRKPGILEAPGRVLWYVSKQEAYQGAMSLRACSQIDEVIVGRPKDLFRRFERLGIYEWKQLLSLAKNDTDNEVMCVRFSNTELFSDPIPWTHLSSLLRDFGYAGNLQSPRRISREAFANIYRLANQKGKS